MADWKNELTKIDAQLEKDRQNQAEFNHRQQLLNSQSPVFWRSVVDLVSDFVKQANERQSGTFEVAEGGSVGEPLLSVYYNMSTRRHGQLLWNKGERTIRVSTQLEEKRKSEQYKFFIKSPTGEVFLQLEQNQFDPTQLAKRFIEALTA